MKRSRPRSCVRPHDFSFSDVNRGSLIKKEVNMSFLKKIVKGAKNVLDGDSDKGKERLCLKIDLFSDLSISNTLYGLGLWRYFSHVKCFYP